MNEQTLLQGKPYVPSWLMGPNYLQQKFAELKRQQEQESEDSHE